MSMFNCRLCGKGIDSDFEDAVEDPQDCCEMVCAQCLPEEDQDILELAAEQESSNEK